MVYRTAPFSMTLNNLKPIFQGHAILWHWISHKRPYGHSYYKRRIGKRTQAFEWHQIQWPWVTLNLGNWATSEIWYWFGGRGISKERSSGNALVSINVVTLRRARLVPGWVTVFGQLNYLDRLLQRSGQTSFNVSSTQLLSPISYKRCYAEFYVRKIPLAARRYGEPWF